MTLLIEALSGVLDTFLLYLFASGFYSKYRSTKYKGTFILACRYFYYRDELYPYAGYTSYPYLAGALSVYQHMRF